MHRLLLVYLLLVAPLIVTAQGHIGIEANFIAGKVFKHSTAFRPPIPDLSTAFDLAIVKQTTGAKDWEQRRHYPIWGVSASYTHYGIDSIYGSAIGLCPFLQLYVIRGKKLEWTLRGGFGIGYITKHYERTPTWDTINNAIGSAFNEYSLFSTDLRYRINSRWSMQLGLNFSHISNGATKQPNLGINMYGGHIGLRYWPGGDKPKLIDKDLPLVHNRILLQARLGFAFNETGHADGPIYPTYLASAWVSKRYKGKNKVYAGLDYSYHTRIYAFQRNNEINTGHEAEHSWKSAVFIGHEWLFGKMSFVGQIGYYIKEAALTLDPYYEKLGYNYYLVTNERGALKELCLTALLKTHKTSAELLEFGIGVGF
jgi:hypothetical protein